MNYKIKEIEMVKESKGYLQFEVELTGNIPNSLKKRKHSLSLIRYSSGWKGTIKAQITEEEKKKEQYIEYNGKPAIDHKQARRTNNKLFKINDELEKINDEIVSEVITKSKYRLKIITG